MSQDPSSRSNRLAVAQPTRAADQNQTLAEADPSTEELLLPSLSDGLTLLDVEEGRGVPILQSLVCDHLLLHEGPAFWVDANGHATTTTLARITPSQRLLDRIHVARGFTAYQHFAAVCELSTAMNQQLRDTVNDHPPANQSTDHEASGPQKPSLIIMPAVDAQYRSDDTLGETHAKTLQARTLARVSAYAEAYDIPVLLTRTTTDSFSTPVVTAADHRIVCEQTRMGPRLVGDDFETLLYPVDDGAYYQTTVAYWQQILATRATQLGVTPTPAGSPSCSDGVGSAITAADETQSFSAEGLREAWTASSGGR